MNFLKKKKLKKMKFLEIFNFFDFSWFFSNFFSFFLENYKLVILIFMKFLWLVFVKLSSNSKCDFNQNGTQEKIPYYWVGCFSGLRMIRGINFKLTSKKAWQIEYKTQQTFHCHNSDISSPIRMIFMVYIFSRPPVSIP